MTWHAAVIAVALGIAVLIDLAFCHREQPADSRRRHAPTVAPVRYQADAKTAYAWSFVCPQ